MNPGTEWALDPAQGVKPLDFGADGLTGSVDRLGRIIALNSFHPVYGYVALTVADPFLEAERYNPAAVRAYRRSLVNLDGFGPQVKPSESHYFLLEHAVPYIRLILEDGSPVEIYSFGNEQGAIQIWRCSQRLRWQGRLSLQRCAYTQLTEGGPAEMPPVQSSAVFENGILTLENPALGFAAAITGFSTEESGWSRMVDGPVELDLPGQAGDTVLCYAFGPTSAAARERAVQLAGLDPEHLLEQELTRWRAQTAGLDRLAARGLVYGQMLAVPVGETRCILTDHMLLPLSWNRDAYYAARLLLDSQPGIVRQHLLWMFETAERPDGRWGRCYLVNGKIKDNAYQLDQQLFPLLELAEYVINTGDRSLWERLYPFITQVVNTLMVHKFADDWLFPTDETPADDPLALSYHLSSHILLWRTFRKLLEIEPQSAWDDLMVNVREAIFRRFVFQLDQKSLFAYAVDAHGRFHLYHDANDLPLALAPSWGFVEASDPVWRATVDFAFSEQNKGGYYDGKLGSIHTRAPWPLGAAQEVIIARALHDPAREQRALAYLAEAAQWDGALPEAYENGEVVSRHWFVWPNAVLTSLLLEQSI